MRPAEFVATALGFAPNVDTGSFKLLLAEKYREDKNRSPKKNTGGCMSIECDIRSECVGLMANS